MDECKPLGTGRVEWIATTHNYPWTTAAACRLGLTDSARYVIICILNPRFWSNMDSARHVIEQNFNPRFLSKPASFEVASTITDG